MGSIYMAGHYRVDSRRVLYMGTKIKGAAVKLRYIHPRVCWVAITKNRTLEMLGSAHEESKGVGSRYPGGRIINVIIW